MGIKIAELRTMTALVTPFTGGEVDHQLLRAAVDRQARAGIDGIIVCDVFGEGYALTPSERDEVLSTCLEQAAGRLAVWAATGTNNTTETLSLTLRAEELGADGVVLTVPYYSKPTQKGVSGHFQEVAKATRLPVILEDDPQRTAIDCGPTLLCALADAENIVGIRHGVGRLEAFHRLAPELKRRYRHYSGDDFTMPIFLACGGYGCVSTLGNIFPYRLASPGDLAFRHAQSLLVAAEGRWDAAVVKAACAILYGTPPEVRLPLVEVEAEVREALAHVLAVTEGRPVPSQALA